MSRFLIIDDQPQIVRHLRKVLQRLGHESAFLTSDQHLEERLAEESFDLILLDYHLGHVTAIDVLRGLKAMSFEHPPVLVLTADHSDELLTTCFEAGAVDFVTKPVSINVLKSRIDAALSRKQYMNLLENHRDELNRLVEEKTLALAQTNEELLRVTSAFQKFVPKVFADHIWKQEELSIGYYEDLPMTVMFADIRGYTSLSEMMSPEEVLVMLNEVYSSLEASFLKHACIIEKFMGDGILALFDLKSEGAGNPIDCAIDMQKDIQGLNAKRIAHGKPPIRLGIGVNTGPVVLGALGMPHRFNSTVIGDAVNLASRIEGITSRYDCRILISDSTRDEHCQAHHEVRLIDQVKVKGKQKQVSLYEVFNNDGLELRNLKNQTMPLYDRVFEAYRSGDFERCIPLLLELIKQAPKDSIGLELLKRCYHFKRYPPSGDWDGSVRTDFNTNIRRQNKRYKVSHPPENLHIQSLSFIHGSSLNAIVRDVSREGFKMDTDVEMFSSNLLELHLDIEISNELRRLQLIGVVMWCEKMESRWQSGLQILFPSVNDEDLWFQHLEQLEKLP